jgi:O-antigen ligase
MNYIIEIFLLLMPWSRNPLSLDPLPLPIGSLFAGLTFVPLFYSNAMNYASNIRREPVVFSLLLYCIFSYCLGMYNLSEIDREYLYLRHDEVLSYFLIGGKKLLQMFFITAVFYIVSGLKEKNVARFQIAWEIGFIISVLVHLIVYIFLPTELLPRAGTFDEGNFAGLYYILTLCLLFSKPKMQPLRQFVTYALCLMGIILSESTIGIVVLIVISGIYIFKRGDHLLKVISVAFLVGSMSLAFVYNVNKLNEKLLSMNITTENMSKYDRIKSFEAGEKIFLEYPILGLGFETYGFLVNDKLEQDEFVFYNHDFRRIPNNVYIEILSQLGIVGFIIFAILFYKIIKLLWISSLELCLGVSAILMYWVAFPSFSVSYIWAYLGFCYFMTSFSDQEN